MSDETTEALPEFARDTIVGVLCSLALADHLGDVRGAEEDLWKLLGVDKLDYYHPALDGDYNAFTITRARLEQAGLELPEHPRDLEASS